MLLNLKFMMFLFMITIGILISISSNNWIMIWCGLELTLICFIPLICGLKLVSSESSMKYFIIQSLSSCIFIFAVMMIFMNLNMNFEFFLMFSLLMKMGCAPFHNWVLTFVEGLNFNLMYLFLTLFKLPPLVILSYMSLYLFPFIILCLIFGSILGLNQNSLSKIIACSSIFNMGFMLSCLFNNFIWLIYLFFYSIILLMFMYFIYNLNLYYLNHMIFNDYFFLYKIVLLMNLLSMGGMPPMTGFMIKFLTLEFVIFNNWYFISLLMIIFSLLVMFFYIRISFTSILIFSSLMKYNFYTMNLYSLIVILMNCFLLPFIFSLIILF